MTAEIIELDIITKLDLPAERVLSRAIDAKLETVVIIGWGAGADGEFYFGSTKADAADVIYLLEFSKKKLLDICDRDNIKAR